MIGRTCHLHDEWCPDGVCKWCEPPQPLDPWIEPQIDVAIDARPADDAFQIFSHPRVK